MKNMYEKYSENFPPVFYGVIEERRSILLEKFIGLIFRHIDFDKESLATLREYSGKGHVVYASFHSSNFALLILYNLLKKHSMKLPALALEYNPFSLQTFEHLWKRIRHFFSELISGRESEFILEGDHVERLIRSGKSIIISLLSKKFFLARYLDIKYDSLAYLVHLQKRLDEPIYLFPQMIFWNMNPERTKTIVSSKATGDRGLFAGWLTTMKSITPAFVRVPAPLNLKDEIANNAGVDSEKLAVILRYRLLDIYHHEKRTVLGPVIRSRQEMMEKVLYHKDVMERIEKLAVREKVSLKKQKKKAYLCLKEISADFSIIAVKFFSLSLKFIFNRIFDGISYNAESLSRIREAAKKGPLILVPCHKSHMDYLILSHLFYENRLVPPHIAAGVNLSFFPMGPIFRRSGAFFIRRSFIGQKLYTVVFRQYIRTLVQEGYTIEIFMEGGRTRTGKLILPQLGFLHFLIEAVESGYNEDLVFVPISINYDRILEEKAHLKEIRGNEKEAESVKSVVRGRKVLRKSYGKVYVSFGETFSYREISRDITEARKLPGEIANRIFNRINDVAVVTSFSLATSAMLLVSRRGFSESALREITLKLLDYLLYINASLSDTLRNRSNIDEIIRHVLQAYLFDRILEQIKLREKSTEEQIDDFYVLKGENRTRICFYKNNIIHYFIPLAYVSLAIKYNHKKGRGGSENIRLEYDFIKDLFSREFVYPYNDDNINKVVEYLMSESVVTRSQSGEIAVDEKNTGDLILYSRMIKDQLESYYIVIKTILYEKEKRIKRNNLLMDARKLGYRMYHLGELDLAEALSVPNFSNAIDKYSNAGILKGGDRLREDVEVEIVDIEAAAKFEARIREYLDLFRV